MNPPPVKINPARPRMMYVFTDACGRRLFVFSVGSGVRVGVSDGSGVSVGGLVREGVSVCVAAKVTVGVIGINSFHPKPIVESSANPFQRSSSSTVVFHSSAIE